MSLRPGRRISLAIAALAAVILSPLGRAAQADDFRSGVERDLKARGIETTTEGLTEAARHHADPTVRIWAMQLLSSRRDESGLSLVLERIATEADQTVRARLAEQLIELDPSRVGLAEEVFASLRDPYERLNLAYALARAGIDTGCKDALTYSRSGSGLDRVYAIKVLAMLAARGLTCGEERTGPLIMLRGIVEHGTPNDQLVLLGMMTYLLESSVSKQAVEWLRRLSSADDGRVRERALDRLDWWATVSRTPK